MTNDQIVEMAKQAKASRTENLTCFAYEELIAFARLIAAKQKEIDAGVAFDFWCNQHDPSEESAAEAIRSQT